MDVDTLSKASLASKKRAKRILNGLMELGLVETQVEKGKILYKAKKR